jgi:ABC-type sugar transport system ATPase subunit
LLDRKPAALSGGQRQRVALARAIVTRPRVYLMDEPLSNLDAKLRAQTRTELVELHRRFSTTVLYVTHDQVEAMTMATRIAVMDAGRLQQVGTPREIYERPANLFVARFIGTPPMDTLDAVVSDEGTATLKVGQQTVPAPAMTTGRLASGKRVVIGVRPEDLVVVPVGDAAEGPRLVGRIVNVEWLGHESLVVVDVEGQWVTVRQAVGEPVPEADTKVALTARPDQVHVFDADTAERVE